MHILSLETSTKVLSLAVSNQDKVLKTKNIRAERVMESSMIRSIEQLLKACGLAFDDISALAVGLGPGSFTSLRVGLSTVKAFALASDKKVVGIGSLDVLACGVLGEKADEICVLVDARRGKVYSAVYDMQGNRKTDYLLTTLEAVLKLVKGTTLFVGDGLSLYQKDIEAVYKTFQKDHKNTCRCLFAMEKFWYPQSRELAKLAWKRIKSEDYNSALTLVPIYLYPQDCQVTNRS